MLLTVVTSWPCWGWCLIGKPDLHKRGVLTVFFKETLVLEAIQEGSGMLWWKTIWIFVVSWSFVNSFLSVFDSRKFDTVLQVWYFILFLGVCFWSYRFLFFFFMASGFSYWILVHEYKGGSTGFGIKQMYCCRKIKTYTNYCFNLVCWGYTLFCRPDDS